MEWVATPPGGARPRRKPRPRRPYAGPPSYPVIPRWGLPPVVWRWPLALPTRTPVDPVERTAALARTATLVLWCTAVLAGAAALAEGWRYVLLVRSLSTALSKPVLMVSDALVTTTGVLTWLLGLAAGVVVVLWALRARGAAADCANARNARPDWQFVAGVLVPGWNLFVPGSVLAEIEHTVLAAEGTRELGARPRPSGLVRAWWAAWVVNLLLGWTTLLWSMRSGVQALADGVLLHVWTDLAIVVLAVLTLRVVRTLTRLLTPVDPTGIPRRRVRAVRGAPALQRAERDEHSPR